MHNKVTLGVMLYYDMVKKITLLLYTSCDSYFLGHPASEPSLKGMVANGKKASVVKAIRSLES